MTNKYQNRGITITAFAILLMVSFITSPGHAVDNTATTKRLILFQGNILHAFHNNKYIEVKRLSPKDPFYGYGWIDDHTVFLAYQREGYAQAIADREIVDLLQNRRVKLESIDNVGESNFDVNPTTGEIVFSDGDNINLLKLNAKRDAYRIQEIKKNASCWAVFWIDSKIVGCSDSRRDDKDTFVKYSIPSK